MMTATAMWVVRDAREWAPTAVSLAAGGAPAWRAERIPVVVVAGGHLVSGGNAGYYLSSPYHCCC